MTPPTPVLAVRRGRSPNCSATGTIVGSALLSLVAAGAVVNAFAHRFARWRDEDQDDDGDAPPPRLRREGKSAWLAWALPPALLQLTPEAAAAALERGAVEVGTSMDHDAPLEVHLALTERCPAACEGCYLDAQPGSGAEADRAALESDLEQLAQMGVFEVAIGGGEALLHPDTLPIIDKVIEVGMVPNLTISGFGLTSTIARQLAAKVGQVNVSFDGPEHVGVRRWRTTPLFERTIRVLRDAGVRVGVNTVLTRGLIPHLADMATHLHALGIEEWQWLRYKPAGRAQQNFEEHRPTPEQLEGLWPQLLSLEAATGLRFRIDCALVPFLAHHAPPIEALERLAVSGCSAGDTLWSRGADGRFTPCSFAHHQNLGDGWAGDPISGWTHAPTLTSWRQRATDPPAPCASCDYQHICRGGCRIVAHHDTGDALAPDPDCPRVRTFRAVQA